jgi:hypothetical protein
LTVLASVAAAAAPGARVERLVLRDDAPVVELGMSGTVEPVLGRLANPPRAYVDLPDTTLAPTVPRSLAGSGVVKQVRLGQFDARTARLVIELDAPAPVEIVPVGSMLRLVVGGTAKAAAPAAKVAASRKGPAPRAAAKPATPIAPATTAAAPKAAPAKTDSTKADPVATAAAPLPPDVPRLTVIHTETPLEHAAPPSTPASSTSSALQERIARRAAADDWAGVVALYGADTDAIRHHVDAATRASVVDALRELGLLYSARKLLGPAEPGEAPALRVARAEVAVVSGDADEAAGLVAGLDDAAVDPVIVPKLRRVRVRLALAQGDLDGAAGAIGTRAIPELRAELAHRAIEVGRDASQARSCRQAVVAFRRALDADGSRTVRAAAGAGLVRSALACGDRDAATSGLGVLAESPHPLLRRAAAVIATTQTEDQRRTATPVRQGG